MALPNSSAPLTNQSGDNKSYLVPFILVTCLFFLWGFAHNLDGILIPHLRKALELTNRQSSLVDVAVFMAYFLMAIPSGIILKKWGYKNGIIAGLVLFTIGVFMFIPAANTRTYEVFLAGLFVLGCGLTVLETAANPYATILGAPESATTRLNFAQSFNGLSVLLAPVVGSMFILSGKEYTPAEMAAMPALEKAAYLSSEAASVKMPYLVLGGFLILVTMAFYFVKFPEIKAEDETDDVSWSSLLRPFRFSHLTWAVIAQFFYVGAQVCVTSFFVRAAMKGGGIDEKTAGYYLGTVYGLLFMVGRFAGTLFMRYVKPQTLLAIYAAICIVLSLVAINTEGQFVVYALGGLGFFMSIMFPTIFSLGIQGLGADTKSGASLIVMAIVGGALFPYIMGGIIDSYGDDIQKGYYVPLVCFFFVLYFGLRGYQVKNQSS